MTATDPTAAAAGVIIVAVVTVAVTWLLFRIKRMFDELPK